MTVKKILKQIKSAESSISMILGIVVVVIVGIILFNYFRGYSSVSQVGLEGEEESQTQEALEGERLSLPTKYIVAEGDCLWKISEKFYQSGYNWVDIRDANTLTNPNQLAEGQELVIPKVEARQPTVSQATASPAQSQNTISGNKYTVVKGDTLWDISVRAYQDGYRWVEIAEANNLSNPNIIHPGNALTIPR